MMSKNSGSGMQTLSTAMAIAVTVLIMMAMQPQSRLDTVKSMLPDNLVSADMSVRRADQVNKNYATSSELNIEMYKKRVVYTIVDAGDQGFYRVSFKDLKLKGSPDVNVVEVVKDLVEPKGYVVSHYQDDEYIVSWISNTKAKEYVAKAKGEEVVNINLDKLKEGTAL